MPATIDHLILGVPDLRAGCGWLEQLVGVRCIEGGHHPGLGTENALLRLGERTYLEVLAPDGTEPDSGVLGFGLGSIAAPSVMGWAVAPSDFDTVVASLNAQGLPIGPVVSHRRLLPSGEELVWQMTEPVPVDTDEPVVMPFLIDWAKSTHPADRLPAGLTLQAVEIATPSSSELQRLVSSLEVPVRVVHGDVPRFSVTLSGPTGVHHLE